MATPFDATEASRLVEAIKGCLDTVAKQLNEEGRASNRDWTQACLSRLASLGEDKNYNAAPLPCCVEHGWLYDLIWWKGDNGAFDDLILAVESEWDSTERFVRYDFQKLIQARSRIKLFISDSLNNGLCETLISDIDRFEQNSNDGEYLFAMYNGDKSKPNGFGFFSLDELRESINAARINKPS